MGVDSMPPTDRQLWHNWRNEMFCPLTILVHTAMSALAGFAKSIKCGFCVGWFFQRDFCRYRRD
jgi:hypothetical protein